MAEYDGSIRINTKIDTANLPSQMQKIVNSIKKAEGEVERLRAKMDALKNQKIPTQDYAQLQAELRKAEARADSLYGKLRVMEKSGVDRTSASYARLREQIAQADRYIDELRADMQDMESSGKAFTLGGDSEEYARMAARVEELTGNIEASKTRLAEMAAKQRPVSSGFESMRKSAAGLLAVLGGFGRIGGKAFGALKSKAKDAFSSINKNTKSSRGVLESFFHRVAGLAKRVFIFSIITRGFRAILNAAKESFTKIADYNANFANSLQGLKNAWSTLWNQFGAAFAPVVQIILNGLSKVVSALSTAMTYVAQFVAFLGGKSTFTRAKQVQDSYNKSLDGTASSAKKAYGALAKFDDLDVLQKKEDDAAGAGAGVTQPEDMFEEVPIDSKLLDWFEKLKDIFSKLFAPLKEAWEREGQFVMDAWKYALDEVWNLIKDIGRDFLTVWNQERTIQMFADILHIVGDIGLAIGNIAHNLDEAWNKNQTGLHILENIRDLFAIIIEHIKNAANATVIWSENLDFSPLLEAFERFTSALYPAVDAVSGILEDFYTNVLLPLGKWTLEKGLPELLDVFTGFLEKVDWDALRRNLEDFWKHLEPFAETVGEGLIIFLERVSDLVAGFLNSETVMGFLDKLKEWMDSVTPEDVADGLKKLAEAILLFKAGSAVANAIVLLTKNLAALKALGAFSVTVSIVLLGIEAFTNWKKDLEYIQEHGIFEWQMKNRTEREDSPWNRYGHDADYDPNANSRFKSADENPWTKMVEENNQAWEEMQANEQQKRSEIEAERKTWWENAHNQFSDAWTSLKESAATAWDNIKQTISEKLTSLKEGILLVWENIKQFFSETWTGIKETAVEIWTGLQEWFGEFWTSFTENLSVVWENIVLFFTETWANIQLIFQTFIDFLSSIFAPIWETIWTTAQTIFQTFSDLLGTLIDAIKELFSGLFRAVKLLIDGDWKGAWDTAKQVFETFKGKIDSIISAVRGILDSFFGWVKEMVSGVLSAISSIGTAISGAASSFGNFVSGIGGKIGGFLGISAPDGIQIPVGYDITSDFANKYDIPRLASGAVIRGGNPFAAILGDQPRGQVNIEAPLDTIRQAVREELLNMQTDASYTFIAQLDGRTIFEETVAQEDMFYNRTGRGAFAHG